MKPSLHKCVGGGCNSPSPFFVVEVMLRHLDLFSGIGGFALGLQRTGGFQTIGFCEIDPFCQKVLRKHWPDVPIYEGCKVNQCRWI